MNGSTFLFMAPTGGVGAYARFWADRGAQRVLSLWGEPTGAKLGIPVVSVVGCFPAGAATRLAPVDLMLAVSAGFLGGFMTFSTAPVDVVTLWTDGFWGHSLIPTLDMWAASWGAALAGIACAG